MYVGTCNVFVLNLLCIVIILFMSMILLLIDNEFCIDINFEQKWPMISNKQDRWQLFYKIFVYNKSSDQLILLTKCMCYIKLVIYYLHESYLTHLISYQKISTLICQLTTADTRSLFSRHSHGNILLSRCITSLSDSCACTGHWLLRKRGLLLMTSLVVKFWEICLIFSCLYKCVI